MERLIAHTHNIGPVVNNMLLLRDSYKDVENGYDLLLIEDDENSNNHKLVDIHR